MFEVVFHRKFQIKKHTQNLNMRLFIGSVLEHWAWKNLATYSYTWPWVVPMCSILLLYTTIMNYYYVLLLCTTTMYYYSILLLCTTTTTYYYYDVLILAQDWHSAT